MPGTLTPEILAKRKETQAKREAQEDRACALRVAGATYAQIATQCQLDTAGGAYKLVQAGLRRAAPLTDRDRLRALEGERLDRLQLACWDQAIKGDIPAVLAVLRVMSQRARLLGLEAPQVIAVHATLEEMAKRIADEHDMDANEIIAIAELHLRTALSGG